MNISLLGYFIFWLLMELLTIFRVMIIKFNNYSNTNIYRESYSYFNY